MGTATSRLALSGLAALTLLATGCGSASKAARSASPAGAAFAWLRPALPPSGWSTARASDGAVLAYPARWQRLRGDPGTVSAALLGARAGTGYLGYLNVTPRQAAESESNWAAFRVAHNREEGDTAVKLEAAAGGLRFLGGRGSCVRDSYSTISHARYIEIACLVAGARATSVIVGAVPPDRWPQAGPVIEHAISFFSP
jgi:hypothetical protein